MIDKLEEAVARALAGWTPNVTSWADVCDNPKSGDAVHAIYLQKARAVIPIIRNAAMDEAAAVAEDHYRDHPEATARARNYRHAGRRIAQSILALKGER